MKIVGSLILLRAHAAGGHEVAVAVSRVKNNITKGLYISQFRVERTRENEQGNIKLSSRQDLTT